MDFIYQSALKEFEDYLDSNHSETVYFETLKLARNNKTNIDFSYQKILKKNIFSLNSVLDSEQTFSFTSSLKSLGKIRKYETYAFETLDSINKKSEFEDRLNSIQAICSFSFFSNKNSFYNKYDNNSHFPISVKLPYQNFDILYSNNPFDVLSELLTSITENRKNEDLYYNFISYYYSVEEFKSIFTDFSKLTLKEKNFNKTAFLIAIIYTFIIKQNIHTFSHLSKVLLAKIIKKITIDTPDDLKSKFHIIEKIEEAVISGTAITSPKLFEKKILTANSER